MQAILDRHELIAAGEAAPLSLPKYRTYAITNLRGCIGKTSIAFNLSYLADNILVADTCPQGNLSYFYDPNYALTGGVNSADLIRPYILPGFAHPTHISQKIGATNEYFADKNSFFVKSSSDLYILPNQISTAMVQARTVAGAMQNTMLDGILYSLRTELAKEAQITKSDKCLIDTSPFFAGATQLAWNAADALIIPVRTDQQSVNSFKLLINMLTTPDSVFLKNLPSDQHMPKIQMVILTHCAWSTREGSRNKPNKQTKMFLNEIYSIVARHINLFSTSDPHNHVMILDDFLGSGRVSTAKSKPIPCLNPGETNVINREKSVVNKSVDKIKNELLFIHNSIW